MVFLLYADDHDPDVCPRSTTAHLHVTFSIILCSGRQKLFTRQGSRELSLLPSDKHGARQL